MDIKDAVIGSASGIGSVSIRITQNRWYDPDSITLPLANRAAAYAEDALEIHRVLYDSLPGGTLDALIDLFCADSELRDRIIEALRKTDKKG